MLVPVDARLKAAPVKPDRDAWRARLEPIAELKREVLPVDAGIANEIERLRHRPTLVRALMLTNLFEASIVTTILHVASAREGLLKRSAAGEESRERAVRLVGAAAWCRYRCLRVG